MEQADDQATGESSRVLRFGILSTGTTFPAWAARCIRGLIALDNVKPELLMIDRPEPGRFRTAGQSAPNRRTSSLYRRALPSPSALMPVDLAVELKGAHTLHGRADADTKRSERFSDDDIERIRSHKLDFILNFDSDTVDENILDAARYGVWCFHHGDRARYGGGPPGFWEIYNGDPATRATLYRVSDDPRSGIALKEGFFPTVNYSYAASLNRVLVDSADWPAQVCIDIKNGNSRYVDASPSKLAAPDDRSPSNAQLLAFLFKIRRNQLANAARMLFCHDEWGVGIVDQPITSCLTEDFPPEIRWLPNPCRNRYNADPFGVTDAGKTSILCEDFDYSDYRGSIAALQISETGALTNANVAISEPFHLSYPYLVRAQGDIYCIPEASESGDVSLYKATCFPSDWVKVTTLIKNFPGVDSTVFEHDNHWWLICTNAGDGRDDKLLVWHADSLFGPWQPHALNPVKIDIRSARPAGTPFMHDGHLYRPAQDCSATYGGRIVINRVTRLTPTAFEEEAYRTIDPVADGQYNRGLHTLSRLGQTQTLVDGKRYRFHLAGLIYGLRFIARKLCGTAAAGAD